MISWPGLPGQLIIPQPVFYNLVGHQHLFILR